MEYPPAPPAQATPGEPPLGDLLTACAALILSRTLYPFELRGDPWDGRAILICRACGGSTTVIALAEAVEWAVDHRDGPRHRELAAAA